MQREVVELVCGGGAFHEQAVGGHAAVAEMLRAAAVEEHHRARWRFCAERGALTLDPRQFGQWVAPLVGVVDEELVTGDFHRKRAVFVGQGGRDRRFGRVELNVEAEREKLVPTCPGNPPEKPTMWNLPSPRAITCTPQGISAPSGCPAYSPWNLKSARPWRRRGRPEEAWDAAWPAL